MPIYTKVYRQGYRVADDSLDRYEMYVGEGAVPDFEDSTQPVATSAALPVNYNPPLPSPGNTKVLYVVVRKRNKYGLLSLNQYPSMIEIDSDGEEVLGELTAPEIVQVVDGLTGKISVTIRYPSGDRNPADTMDIYAEEGVYPDPDVDDPVETIDMGTVESDYVVRQLIEGLTPGNTVYILVVVSRSEESDGLTGESDIYEHNLPPTYDVDSGSARLFGADRYEVD